MFDEPKNQNTEQLSDSELIALFRQTFPIFKEAYQRFCPSDPISCQDCSKKIACDRFNKNKSDITCLILESSLPGKYEGVGYREKNAGLMIKEYTDTDHDLSEDAGDDDDDNVDVPTKQFKSTLKAIRKARSDEEFMLYKNCPPFIFRPEQWEAVFLRFEHGLKQRQIAKTLGISRTAVSDRLRRAKKNMQNYYRSKNS
jgi:RNA polymerase sigma factor (sigma-70 family)